MLVCCKQTKLQRTNMFSKTTFYEIRNQHLNKVICNNHGDFLIGNKFYSYSVNFDRVDTTRQNHPWKLRLLSYRIWEETVDISTGKSVVKLTKCPKDQRLNHDANDCAFMIAKIASINVNLGDWT